MQAQDIDITTVTPSGFARLVKDHDDAQLLTIGRELGFEPVFDQVFSFIPQHYRGGTEGTLQFVVRQDDEELRYGLDVDAETCRELKGRVEDPRATVLTSGVPLCKLLTGQASDTALLLKGRLRVRGDLLWARSLLRSFDLPQP